MIVYFCSYVSTVNKVTNTNSLRYGGHFSRWNHITEICSINLLSIPKTCFAELDFVLHCLSKSESNYNVGYEKHK